MEMSNNQNMSEVMKKMILNLQVKMIKQMKKKALMDNNLNSKPKLRNL